jgi:eukaryotic-like serine/threonine-protein kinase
MFGPYRIGRLIGVGGMGEVYAATDTRLDREVAIKVLGEHIAADPESRARFEREARLISGLNHPHVATLHDIGEHDGTIYLVMELVEGPTLAHRIAEGPVPFAEAIEIATQIANGLEAAHEQGIVHRDLKPSNVKLRADGTVKVLDFGIAKALNTHSVAREGQPTTAAGAMTKPGVVVGTAAYMSPEQARGKSVDKRTDVWAFGCVLYEMLTGQQAFGGEDDTSTLAKVLERDADMRVLPAELPTSARRAIELCLEKDPRKRLRDIGDMRLALQGKFFAEQPAETARAGGWRRFALPALGVLVVGAAATGLAVRNFQESGLVSAAGPELRFEIATAAFTDATSLALSPDGTTIVFEADSDGQSRLWLHSLQSLSARPLIGTESGSFPFWSPNGRSLAFFADGKLKRIDLDTDTVRTLADAAIGRGGAWNEDDTIIFAPGTNDPLLRVNAMGGVSAVATQLQSTQAGHRFPQFLPDGKHFLYYATGSPESRGVFLGDVDGPTSQRLFDADTGAVLTSSGYLFFARQGAVQAYRFDPNERALLGSASAVSERVAIDGAIYRIALTASMTGAIAYRAESLGASQRFSWFDRSGSIVESIGEPMNGALSPAKSPDGQRIGFSRTVNGNQDIWMLDVASGSVTRFTFDAGLDFSPLWSPDGSRVVFSSSRSGVFDLYVKSATGAGTEELLLATPDNKFPVDWSSDGRSLLFVSNNPEKGYDLWGLSVDDPQARPVPVVSTPFDERDGQFSPDGKWIAYQSNESGRLEVYAQPFPGTGGRWQISTGGGAQVRWRGDGNELFYLSLDGRLLAVPLRYGAGPAIEAGAPTTLFTPRLGRGVQTSNRQQYIVSADGQRFLMNATIEDATRTPVTMVLNWRDAQ